MYSLSIVGHFCPLSLSFFHQKCVQMRWNLLSTLQTSVVESLLSFNALFPLPAPEMCPTKWCFGSISCFQQLCSSSVSFIPTMNFFQQKGLRRTLIFCVNFNVFHQKCLQTLCPLTLTLGPAVCGDTHSGKLTLCCSLSPPGFSVPNLGLQFQISGYSWAVGARWSGWCLASRLVGSGLTTLYLVTYGQGIRSGLHLGHLLLGLRTQSQMSSVTS